MYSREPEPPGYSNEYYSRDSEYDRESSHKRSTASVDKNFSNRTYGEEKYGFDEKDDKHEKDNYDDKRNSYDREKYDDDYDDRYDDDDRYSDRYDDDRYDDNYSDRYDDFDRDDNERRRSYDKEPYDDRRRSYEKEPYGDRAYEPYDRKDDRGYDIQMSQDDRRPISGEIRDYNTESSKFDPDGYPIEVKKSGKGTPPKNGGSSTFV